MQQIRVSLKKNNLHYVMNMEHLEQMLDLA